jgi:hypothetical protein
MIVEKGTKTKEEEQTEDMVWRKSGRKFTLWKSKRG